MKKIERIKRMEFILEKSDKIIIAITNDFGFGRRIKLGSDVIANGLFAVPAGTKGKVIAIYEPFSWGKTEDVIDVKFDGYSEVHSMKFKDLQ